MKGVRNNTQYGGISKKAALLVTAIFLLALAAAGFFYWSNIKSSDSTNSGEQAVSNDSSSNREDKVAVDDKEKGSEKPSAVNDDYFVLEDWNVKFKLPPDIGEVKYYKVTIKNDNGTFVHYEFTTKRVEDLGENCKLPNESNFVTRLGSLSRSKEKKTGYGQIMINNEKLNDYYYYYASAQSVCSTQQMDLQSKDRSSVEKMLLSLESV